MYLYVYMYFLVSRALVWHDVQQYNIPSALVKGRRGETQLQKQERDTSSARKHTFCGEMVWYGMVWYCRQVILGGVGSWGGVMFVVVVAVAVSVAIIVRYFTTCVCI